MFIKNGEYSPTGEFRRDHELPYVIDTDPRVVEALAELVGQAVDFTLPGVGIRHDVAVVAPQDEVHRHHQHLILRAINSARPAIVAAPAFRDGGRTTRFPAGSTAHTDLDFHLIPNYAMLPMYLRLHTADDSNGARVTLGTATPGFAAKPGDSDLFGEGHRAPDIVREYGYDGHRSFSFYTNSGRLIEYIDNETYDPVVAEPDIFHYHQSRLSSVLFRSKTSLGPPSLHGFEPENPEPRKVRISDLVVYSQT